jgi:hypothetical protein
MSSEDRLDRLADIVHLTLYGQVIRREHPAFLHGEGSHDCSCYEVVNAVLASPAPDDTTGEGTEPDDNPTGLPHCHKCGDVTFRPDQFGPRRPARRCAGCHKVTGNCDCPPAPPFTRALQAAGIPVRTEAAPALDVGRFHEAWRLAERSAAIRAGHRLTPHDVVREYARLSAIDTPRGEG